jgi:uncharacterized membrane protein YfcA
MKEFLIESVLGLLSGMFLGITGIVPTGIILIILDVLKIGNYKSNIGSILLLHLFPLSIGSMYSFSKSGKINFSLVFILLITTILGSYIGSKMIIGKKSFLTDKDIKYITSFLSIFTGIVFFISAYYDTTNN